jgi:hypothetical protein
VTVTGARFSGILGVGSACVTVIVMASPAMVFVTSHVGPWFRIVLVSVLWTVCVDVGHGSSGTVIQIVPGLVVAPHLV